MQIRMGKFKEFKFKERLFKYGLRETERYKADIFFDADPHWKKTEYVSFEFSPKKQSRLCIGEHGKRVYCRQGSLKKRDLSKDEFGSGKTHRLSGSRNH